MYSCESPVCAEITHNLIIYQSVYAEIALSLGDFLKKRDWSSTKACGVAVTDMVIEKALIAAPRGPQILEVSAELVGVNREAKCTFSTIDVRSPTPVFRHGC